jgi:DNA helicase-2/ATP-dependent DNA helicase PcrA
MVQKKFDEQYRKRYKRLNQAQKKAVDAIDGPMMVVAGPGTGKTSILTLRIANILRKTDTPPEAILALTFTETGAKTMRRELWKIIGERAHRVHIHTFHGFAAWVIAAYGDHFVHYRDAVQMTEVDAEALIRQILLAPKFKLLRPVGNPDYFISAILSAISQMKKEAIMPEKVRAFAAAELKRIESDENSVSTRGITKGQLKAEAKKQIEKCRRTAVFADVYEMYERTKRLEKKNDYDDLIIELLTAMKNDELLLRLLQEQFLYILVDEHQDTNDSQNLALNLLAEFFETPNLFIVGDEKQAIYRFQGASVENFLRLRKLYPKMEIVELSENYRSHQHLLDASLEMVRNNYGEGDGAILPKSLTARARSVKRPLEIVSGGKQEIIEQHLVNRLKKIIAEEKEATVAVIVRTNEEVGRIYDIIDRAGLSAAAERNIDALSHPLGVLFLELLRAVNDPGDLENLAKTVAGGLWNLSFAEAAAAIREIRSGRLAELQKRLPALDYLRKSLPTSGAVDFFIRLGEESGFIATALKTPAGAEVWRGIVALGEFAAREIGRSDTRSVSERLFLYADSGRKVSVKISVGGENAAIKVMTAHGSKGSEFDYVFIPYATEESWLRRHHSSPFVLPKEAIADESERDARRLFFVALTRAKKHAILLTADEGLGGEKLMPVRFIAEIGDRYRIEVKTSEKPAPSGFFLNRRRREAERDVAERTAYAQKTLMEQGLSVTALNHFLKCPNEFFFLSILKLPQAPNPNAEKGSAMHYALARVWAKRAKTAKQIEKVIKSSVAEFLAGSLLSEKEKMAVREKLSEEAPAVAKALEGHFGISGDVRVESWFREIFRSKIGAEELEIPLHGKLDVVASEAKNALVFDYKTKRGMSENEIRGLTKNSDGGYFRQLVFYKLLLSADRRFKEKSVIPSLVFVSPDAYGRCPTVTLPVTEKDVAALKNDIRKLVESVWSGEFLSQKCDDRNCRWCQLSGAVGQ